MKQDIEVTEDALSTRSSLVRGLQGDMDETMWRDFDRIYWPFIYRVARRAGLSDADAQEVTQETAIAVFKRINDFDFDHGSGRFRGWLKTIARWKVGERYKTLKRRSAETPLVHSVDECANGLVMDSFESIGENSFDKLWRAEWAEKRVEMALTRLQSRSSAKHYQIFHQSVVEERSPTEIARRMKVSVAQVYLIRHRMRGLLENEQRSIDEEIL